MPLRTLETWPHGAIMLDAQHTRFALWAPDAFYVSVELQDGRSVAMLPQANGWFETEIKCPAGTRYRYNIDGEMDVPDPASRAQASDVHGWSLVVDPLAYEWRHHPWQGRPWHEAVIYELHVGALGGFAAVEQHLPRLAELGVTAIELMPLAQFPGERNWGYDGVLPYAPHAAYGSPEQLKHLIDSAHEHGLAVLLDVVYNHFGPDGNYLGQYAKDFFQQDVHTPWGAGIDFERREVRDFFLDNALMWLLDYRFDGLRLDAVHAIDNPGFLRELAHRVRQQVDIGRHVWLVLENELNQASLLKHDFDAQWNDDFHNVLHVLLTGETDAYYSDLPKRLPPNSHVASATALSTKATPRATGMHAANPAAACRPPPSSRSAEPRPDRQPRPRRTPAPTVFAPGAEGGDHLATDVADDPVAIHGR